MGGFGERACGWVKVHVSRNGQRALWGLSERGGARVWMTE